MSKEQIKCPYVEKVKSITGKEEFDCETCPALVCSFPEVKEELKRNTWRERSEQRQELDSGGV